MNKKLLAKILSGAALFVLALSFGLNLHKADAQVTMVNGVCGSSNGAVLPQPPTTGLCASGTATTVTYTSSKGPYKWECRGSNGGSSASCSATNTQAVPVNGTCGTSNGGTFSTKPTTGLCSSGTTSTVSGTGPWSWSCGGTNGGTTANCSANLTAAPAPVNGMCGTSNGGTFSSVPTTGFCSSGTVTLLSGTGPWTWGCTGSNGGSAASCSANINSATAPMDAVCGTSQGQQFSSAPTTGLCSVGTATPVQDPGGMWTWGCLGVNGGNPVSCYANYPSVTPTTPINGTCGGSNGGTFPTKPTNGLCSLGVVSTVSGTGPWNWSCAGTNGGTTANCSANLGGSTTCVRANPTVTISPSTQTDSPGVTLSYTSTIKNNDSTACGSSIFKSYQTVPSGWSSDPITTSSISPGASATITIPVKSWIYAPAGSFDIKQVVANGSYSFYRGEATAKYVVSNYYKIVGLPAGFGAINADTGEDLVMKGAPAGTTVTARITLNNKPLLDIKLPFTRSYDLSGISATIDDAKYRSYVKGITKSFVDQQAATLYMPYDEASITTAIGCFKTSLITEIAENCPVRIEFSTKDKVITVGGKKFVGIPVVFNTYNAGGFGGISVKDSREKTIWPKVISLGLPIGENTTLRMATDKNGNIYYTGFFKGTRNFNPNGVDVKTSKGDADIFLTKINADGTYGWTKTMGGIESDVGADVTVDSIGNIYLVGSFRDLVNFNPDGMDEKHAPKIKNAFPGPEYLWQSDAFVTKFNSDGSYGWTKQLGSIGGLWQDNGISIAVDNSGGLYVTGFNAVSQSFSLDGVKIQDPLAYGNMALGGGQAAFLVKLNASDGSHVWNKLFVSTTGSVDGVSRTPRASATEVIIDGQNNVYVAGRFAGHHYFNYHPNIADSQSEDPAIGRRSSKGGYDIFLVKYSAEGTFDWVKSFGSTGNEFLTGLAIDPMNNVTVSGLLAGSTNLNPDGSDVRNTLGYNDGFINKFGSDGVYKWGWVFGGSADDQSYGVTSDNEGNTYATGLFNGTVNFNRSGSDSKTSRGISDVYVTKINADGTYGWTKTIGGSKQEKAFGILFEPVKKTLYLIGVFNSLVNFDPNGENFRIATDPISDMFLAKISTTGEFASGNPGPSLGASVFDAPELGGQNASKNTLIGLGIALVGLVGFLGYRLKMK